MIISLYHSPPIFKDSLDSAEWFKYVRHVIYIISDVLFIQEKGLDMRSCLVNHYNSYDFSFFGGV